METDSMKIKKVDTALYGFVTHSLEELGRAVEWAKAISEGASLHERYYLTTEDGKLDYSEPNTGLILSVVSYGKELGIAPMRSLSMIIPLEGKFTIRGDQAKSMIFQSGMVKEWKEVPSGSIEDGSFKYTITATRIDGITLTREFGVDDAKRADLWVTDVKLKGAFGNKHRASPWYRYPARMCMYRALGFLARDLFSDVMGGLILYEEAGDYPDMAAVFVETKGGDIPLANKDGKIAKSEQESGKIKKKSERRDEELKVEESLEEAHGAAKEMESLEELPPGQIRVDSMVVKIMDEGCDFMDHLDVGDIIKTNYRTGPYKVEAIHICDTIYDPRIAEEVNLPEEAYGFSMELLDPEHPRKARSYLNNYIIQDGRFLSQATDDEIFKVSETVSKTVSETVEKDPTGDQALAADMALEDTDVRGTPGAGIPSAPPHDNLEETHIIEENPWGPIEAAIKDFPDFTEQELLQKGADIYTLAIQMGLADLINALPGIKTNKKYRNIIIAAKQGRMAEVFKDLIRSEVLEKTLKKLAFPKGEEKPPHPTPGENTDTPENDGSVEEDAALEEMGTTNKFNIVVPNPPEGYKMRDFQDARKLAFDMTDVGLDTMAWTRIASQLIYNQQKGLTYLTVFNTKEEFCKNATTVDIHYLINHHEG